MTYLYTDVTCRLVLVTCKVVSQTVNLEAKERLAEVVRKARGHLSQRAFARKLGVSLAAVQGWEMGRIPGPENLSKIAQELGYTLEELMRHIEGRPQPQVTDIDQMLMSIRHMPLPQVALIAHAVGDRLAAVAEGK